MISDKFSIVLIVFLRRYKISFNLCNSNISNGLKFTAEHVLLRDSARVRFCAAQFGQLQKIGKIPYNSEKYAEIVIYIRHWIFNQLFSSKCVKVKFQKLQNTISGQTFLVCRLLFERSMRNVFSMKLFLIVAKLSGFS